MDSSQVKLLIVLDNNTFLGLLSLGDIQRAILDKISLDLEIENIMRKTYKVGSTSMTEKEIRELMIEDRIECMPVISDNKIIDAYFWDDLFPKNKNKKLLNIPVVIMAGGKGSRLKPLTNVIPKPLVPIGEKPIIEIIMDSFSDIGVDKFLVSVNYKADMIKRYFEEINPSYKISYFKENKPLGTAGSMYMLKNKITSTFFVTNCDILINQNYHDIYEYHKNNKNDITIVASLKHYKIPYGTIETGMNGELLSMEEKPELTFMINTGMYILEADVLNELNDDEFLHITDLIDNLKKKNKKIGVFPVSEKSWMDIGQWDEYHQTLKDYELKFNK
jgi:dTDP-glucose pyrophosphorylase